MAPSISPGKYMVVVGSVNQDIFSYVANLPLPGQTVLATTAATGLGGKGANQAVAAARLGADVEFIGRLGDDLAGQGARALMVADGVGIGQLHDCENMRTGTAHIAVEESGENAIIVYSGANALLTADDVTIALEELVEARGGQPTLLLAQGELRGEVADRVAMIARERGIRFVLNLAPVVPVARETLSQSDPLIVNEGEALELLAEAPEDGDLIASAAATAETLARSYGTSVVVTLGASGAVAVANGRSWRQPSPVPRRIVDTTGAGDAFVGALAFSLWSGSSLFDAVRLGTAAGSHAVAIEGTTTSYPDRERLSSLGVMTGCRSGETSTEAAR